MEDKDLHWWEKPEYKKELKLPVSIIQSGEYWVAASNSDTEKLLGKHLHGCSQAKSEEEAIAKFYESIRIMHEFVHIRMMDYERKVPLIIGPWKHDGGKWFIVFGIHFYFRGTTKARKPFMKGGWFIPFTNLNIRVSSVWKTYKKFKEQLKTEKEQK